MIKSDDVKSLTESRALSFIKLEMLIWVEMLAQQNVKMHTSCLSRLDVNRMGWETQLSQSSVPKMYYIQLKNILLASFL